MMSGLGNSAKGSIHTNRKLLIIFLWIAVMFNMVFIDVFSLVVEVMQ